MSWIAVATVGGAAITYLATTSAANTAANAQTHAASSSNEAQRYMYDQNRADAAPWRNAGGVAIGQLSDQLPELNRSFSMNDFKADPGYQFRMDQANQAIERSAAARGGLNSGATMKALTNYNQGAASQEYQNAYSRFTNDQSNRFNRLAAVAGIGQTANQGTAAAGTNYANQVSQNNQGAANAQSAASMAGANALNSAVGTGMNTWMQYQMMNRAFPSEG